LSTVRRRSPPPPRAMLCCKEDALTVGKEPPEGIERPSPLSPLAGDPLPAGIREILDAAWESMHKSLEEQRIAHEEALRRALPGLTVSIFEAHADEVVPTPLEAEVPAPEPQDGGADSESKPCVPDAAGADDEVVSELWERRELAIEVSERLHELQSYAPRGASSLPAMVEAQVLRLVHGWLSIEEPRRIGRAAALAQTAAFKVVVGAAIAANTAWMVYGADLRAERPGEASLPASFQIVEAFFVLFFAAELTLKLWVHRLDFFCNVECAWNIFDMFVVAQSIFDLVADRLVDDTGLSGNLTFLRSFRALRFARSLRVLRVFEFAAPLRRMVMSITGSIVGLFWSLVMLFFVLAMCGLMMVEVMANALPHADITEEQRVEVQEAFGSVGKATLSFYMATSGGNDWSLYFDLARIVSVEGAVIVMFVVAYMQVAMLNILTGMFVEGALKLAEPDHAEQALLQRRADFIQAKELERFFASIGLAKAGKISRGELHKIANDPKLSAEFAVMGFEVRDADLFYEVLRKSCKVEEVDTRFMVDACMRMKGAASSIELQIVAYRVLVLGERVDELVDRLSSMYGGARQVSV